MSTVDKYRALQEQQKREEQARLAQLEREQLETKKRLRAQRAAQEAEEDRKDAEWRAQQQRAQQLLRSLCADNELRALGNKLGGRIINKAQVAPTENGLGLRLRWDHEQKRWPACVEDNYKQVEVTVDFDDQGRPTGLHVSGTYSYDCSTADELQDALARAALIPEYVSEKDFGPEPEKPFFMPPRDGR